MQDLEPAGPADTSAAGVQVTENSRGVIAENYEELQGLPVLRKARQRHPLPPATWDSSVRAVFQSAEVALLNLSDLLRRAASDVRERRVEDGVVKLSWARGFHRVLIRLGLCLPRLGLTPALEDKPVRLRLADSPALREYVVALKGFDASVLEWVASGDLRPDLVLATESLGNPRFNLLHLARICSHESTVWEENLAVLFVSAPSPPYEEFVASTLVRDAVYDRTLRGDTFFMQFRGLHQIPETIGEEINDHLAAAIVDTRNGRTLHAIEHLGAARALADVVESCLPPMVDSLATSDYHQIRENLGLTSGSHSICLRYDMFTHLYRQLWETITSTRGDGSAIGGSEDAPEAFSRRRIRHRDEPVADDVYLLLSHCLALRSFIFSWRAEHLHLPRNNLGGDETRSLTGSHDAVRTVANLRKAAMSQDPFRHLAYQWGLTGSTGDGDGHGMVASYLESEASLDHQLLRETGYLTQNSFTDVQQRSGYFAQRSSFRPPSSRRA